MCVVISLFLYNTYIFEVYVVMESSVHIDVDKIVLKYVYNSMQCEKKKKKKKKYSESLAKPLYECRSK